MKNVREYEKTMTGGFLNENEVELLSVVVKKICDNHPDDDFWKINDSIKRTVSLQLSLIEQTSLLEKKLLKDKQELQQRKRLKH